MFSLVANHNLRHLANTLKLVANILDKSIDENTLEEVEFNASHLSKGLYILPVTTSNGDNIQHKLILLKKHKKRAGQI